MAAPQVATRKVTTKSGTNAGPRNGFVKTTYSDNSVYEGHYSNDAKNGPGIYHMAGGGLYEGEFRHGRFHGWGCIEWPTGEVYLGEWANGAQEGFGIQIWPNGQKYIGWWHQGMREGYGHHSFQSTGCYRGRWKANQRHGFVFYTFPDGDVSLGLWEHGKIRHHFESVEEAKDYDNDIRTRPAIPAIPPQLRSRMRIHLTNWDNVDTAAAGLE